MDSLLRVVCVVCVVCVVFSRRLSVHDGVIIISYFSYYGTARANPHTLLRLLLPYTYHALFIRDKERLRENLHDLRGCLHGIIARASAGILEEYFIAAILQHILLDEDLIIKQLV